MSVFVRFAGFAGIAGIAALAACGGGTSQSNSPAIPGPAASGAPSPVPTSIASAPASAAQPVASPAAIVFASNASVTVAVDERGSTTTYAESDTCSPLAGKIANVATVTNASGAATFAVTPLGAGSCTITVADATGSSVAIAVTVSAAAIVLQ